MSKNIKLNGKDYNGISTVQLPTASGGTAEFIDVEDAVMPDGTVEIKTNGMIDIRNFAMANVNVPTEGGVSFETGTFVGDGTANVTLPVTSKKRGYAIKLDDYDAVKLEDLSVYPQHSTFSRIYDSEFKIMMIEHIYNNKLTGTGATVTSSNVINRHEFNDTSIKITYGVFVAFETFIDGKTYTWIAW